MESHKRVLGILFIVSGVLLIFGMIFMMGFFSILFPMVMQEVPANNQWSIEWVLMLIQSIGWFVILLFALPKIIAGVGLLNKKSWAPTMALIFGCLGVLNFPIGTALCGYTIWVYIEDGKEKRAAA